MQAHSKSVRILGGCLIDRFLTLTLMIENVSKIHLFDLCQQEVDSAFCCCREGMFCDAFVVAKF